MEVFYLYPMLKMDQVQEGMQRKWAQVIKKQKWVLISKNIHWLSLHLFVCYVFIYSFIHSMLRGLSLYLIYDFYSVTVIAINWDNGFWYWKWYVSHNLCLLRLLRLLEIFILFFSIYFSSLIIFSYFLFFFLTYHINICFIWRVNFTFFITSDQATAMAKWVSESDIVITTALIPGRPAPKLISATMLEGMKPGSGEVYLTVSTVFTVNWQTEDALTNNYHVQQLSKNKFVFIKSCLSVTK